MLFRIYIFILHCDRVAIKGNEWNETFLKLSFLYHHTIIAICCKHWAMKCICLYCICTDAFSDFLWICLLSCTYCYTCLHAYESVKFSWKQLDFIIHSFYFIRSVALCRWPQSESVSAEPMLCPPEVETQMFPIVCCFFFDIPLYSRTSCSLL